MPLFMLIANGEPYWFPFIESFAHHKSQGSHRQMGRSGPPKKTLPVLRPSAVMVKAPRMAEVLPLKHLTPLQRLVYFGAGVELLFDGAEWHGVQLL